MTRTPDVVADVLWLPKDDEYLGEYQDACCLHPDGGRFALADGASNSYDSQKWAAHLTQRFVQDAQELGDRASVIKWLSRRARQWQVDLPAEATWFHQDAARDGSFATLLGVALERETGANAVGLSWRAVALGDTCMFHVRRSTLVSAFPLSRVESFGVRPSLAPSDENLVRGISADIALVAGRLLPGEHLFLATDALAKWLISLTDERSSRAWRLLADIDSVLFAGLVRDLQSSGMMESDDVTLVRITTGAAEDNLLPAAQAGSALQSRRAAPRRRTKKRGSDPAALPG